MSELYMSNFTGNNLQGLGANVDVVLTLYYFIIIFLKCMVSSLVLSPHLGPLDAHMNTFHYIE